MFDGMIRSDMIIKNIGNSLAHILPELIGQDISEVFDLTRPLVDFKFTSVTCPPPLFFHECCDYMHTSYLDRVFFFQILKRTNNIFELVSHKSLVVGGTNEIGDTDSEDSSRKIHLKGELTKRYSVAISTSYLFFLNAIKTIRTNALHGRMENDRLSRHPTDE